MHYDFNKGNIKYVNRRADIILSLKSLDKQFSRQERINR